MATGIRCYWTVRVRGRLLGGAPLEEALRVRVYVPNGVPEGWVVVGPVPHAGSSRRRETARAAAAASLALTYLLKLLFPAHSGVPAELRRRSLSWRWA